MPPPSKIAANKGSRKNDVITALHHRIFGGRGGYLGWAVTVGQGESGWSSWIANSGSVVRGGLTSWLGWPDVSSRGGLTPSFGVLWGSLTSSCAVWPSRGPWA